MSDEKHDSSAPAAGAGHDSTPPPADPHLVTRRRMLARVSIGLGAAGGAAIGVPMVGFIVGPLFHGLTPRPPSPDAPEWRTVGRLSEGGKNLMVASDDGTTSSIEFSPGTTLEAPVIFDDASSLPWSGVTGRTAAYLRRVTDTECAAFAINCAHLGCPVRWLPKAGLFMCPCHGGVYYADGTVAAGPPPHALPRYPTQIKAGSVQIWPAPLPVT